jgi:hypothetical protein
MVIVHGVCYKGRGYKQGSYTHGKIISISWLISTNGKNA